MALNVDLKNLDLKALPQQLNLNELDLSSTSFSFSEIRPYLFNIKALAGIAFVIFAISSIFTSLPEKFGTYFSTVASNQKLQESKKGLAIEENKLRRISEELSKFSTQSVKVKEGDSPELIMIKVAQKVVELSEKTENVYVNLQPIEPTVLNVDESVNLPISIPGSNTAPKPADAPAGPTPADAPPTVIPSTPAPGASGSDTKAQMNAFQYVLNLKGSYVTLAQFIHDLSKMRELIMITRITLTPISESAQGMSDMNPDFISMKLEFAIPWQKK